MTKLLDLPKETLCFDCKWRLSRIASPIDPDDFGLEEGMVIIEHACCVLEDDISNIIIHECTRYEKGIPIPFINMDTGFI